jgi:hypothetical protein
MSLKNLKQQVLYTEKNNMQIVTHMKNEEPANIFSQIQSNLRWFRHRTPKCDLRMILKQ